VVAIIIDDHILARNVNAVASTGVESSGGGRMEGKGAESMELLICMKI